MVRNDETSENDALRSHIKQAASSNNLFIDESIECVFEQATQLKEGTAQAPQKSLTQEQLAQVLHASEQISQSTQGQVFEDPVEVIRKMREERLQELETNLTGYIV
jgi:hypothetical protein